MYRDRSKIIRRIVIIGILLLALGGGAVALHSVYTVRTVYVEGNVHYTEDEIMEIVMSGPLGDNSLYLSLKYRDRGIQGAFLQPCGAGRATAGGGSAGVFQDHGSDKAFEQIFTGCGQDLSAFFR